MQATMIFIMMAFLGIAKLSKSNLINRVLLRTLLGLGIFSMAHFCLLAFFLVRDKNQFIGIKTNGLRLCYKFIDNFLSNGWGTRE
jgi:hypothetical protein